MVPPNTIEFPASSFIEGAAACHSTKKIVSQKAWNGIGSRTNRSVRRTQKLRRRNANKIGNSKRLSWAKPAVFFNEKKGISLLKILALFAKIKAEACFKMAKNFSKSMKEWGEKQERLRVRQVEVDRVKDGCLADDFTFEMLRADYPGDGVGGNLCFHSNLWKLVSKRLFA